MIKKIIFYISAVIFSFTNIQCESGDRTVDCFPYSTVNYRLNLTLPSNKELLNVGGWVYISQGNASGTRGLIVTRSGINSYKAYDRNAPHLCPSSDTTLEVKSGISIYCPADGAEWLLTEGGPAAPYVTSIPVKQYAVSPSGNILIITN